MFAKIRMPVAVLMALAGTAVAARGEDEPLSLRYKFESEQPLIYRTVMTTEQTQTLAGQKIETKMTNTDVTVRSLEKQTDDGNFEFKAENKRLALKMKSAAGEYTFDSTSTEREKGSVLGALLNPLYERLSGAVLKVTTTPRGEVKEVEGFTELVADLLKDNPLAAQFAGGGDKAAGKFSYQETLDQFPEGPVKKGDTWEIPYELELPKLGKAKGKRVYVCEGADKVGDVETVKISIKVDLSFDVDLDMGGAKVTGKMAIAESSGTLQFDARRGRVVQRKARYVMNGDLTVVAGGMTIPVGSNQTQDVTIDLLDKLPD